MRKRKAIINSAFSILLEVVTVISGFILPRLIIRTYGSDVNGLVSSIANFVGYITLLQSGVGSVAKAAMYKPLAENDRQKLYVIVKTVERFFRKIAAVTVAYIAVLSILFPTVIASESGTFLYTASLVVIIGISTAAQYFFGITHQMLLEADQRSYVYSVIQIAAVIVNTVLSVVLIKTGQSIQVVKLGSAVIFILRPLVLSIYSNRKYKIDRSVGIDNSLIKQRWDGFAQAIAYFIHSKTDVFVLTIFATIRENISLGLVSVYSVYSMVTVGLTSFIKAIDRAVTAAIGNIIALGERENLIKTFNMYNTFMHMLCTAVFSTASITIFRFIGVYVKNVNDAEYIQYMFGAVIIAAEYLYCIRLPYNSVIYAAGKFRETRVSAAVEAAVNIVISVILVNYLGLLGVAIGTFTAMAYRTISFIRYLSRDVLQFSVASQIKRYAISVFTYSALIVGGSFVRIETPGFLAWTLYAGCVFAFTGVVNVAVNLLFARADTLAIFRTLINIKKKIK